MGRDKALVELGGRPLIAHAVGILREAGLTASIAGARQPLQEFAPVIEDREPGLGPLAGICSALASITARYAVFISVDAPLIPPSLVAYLLHHAQVTGHAVTLVSVCAFPQTFPAVLDRKVLPVLQAELASGRRGCHAAFEAAAAAAGRRASTIAVELLAQCGQGCRADALPAAKWFLNANTPSELEAVRALMEAKAGYAGT